MKTEYKDAEIIIRNAINEVLSDKVVCTVFNGRECMYNVYIVAVGKAAWKMAYTCKKILDAYIKKDIILTRYGCAQKDLTILR